MSLAVLLKTEFRIEDDNDLAILNHRIILTSNRQEKLDNCKAYVKWHHNTIIYRMEARHKERRLNAKFANCRCCSASKVKGCCAASALASIANDGTQSIGSSSGGQHGMDNTVPPRDTKEEVKKLGR